MTILYQRPCRSISKTVSTAFNCNLKPYSTTTSANVTSFENYLAPIELDFEFIFQLPIPMGKQKGYHPSIAKLLRNLDNELLSIANEKCKF